MTPEERREELVRRLSVDPDGASIGALADDLRVATRTIERDVDNLRERGYRIESQRSRSGGVRMIAPPAPTISDSMARAPGARLAGHSLDGLRNLRN